MGAPVTNFSQKKKFMKEIISPLNRIMAHGKCSENTVIGIIIFHYCFFLIIEINRQQCLSPLGNKFQRIQK